MISPVPFHLVRVGALGHVGRFASSDGVRYPRGTRVLCRTDRGLEVGEILSVAPVRKSTEADQPRWIRQSNGAADGSLVRALTAEDELIQSRLKKNRESAYRACAELIQQHEVAAVLVDVEHLFDGSSLYFYFMGEIPTEFQSVVDTLAETYEAKVRIRDFAQAVEEGCGPGCGTEDSAGCGSGGCSTCSIASACKS